LARAPSKILAAIVARAEILRRAPCLRRQDVHAGEVGNKYVGPLSYLPTHPNKPHFDIRGLIQTD
jgi:hypothetical protein